MDEAIAKLQAGTDFDVFFPTDWLGKLVAAKLLQPVNLDYLPNLQNMWPELQSPFYDVDSRYTVPYVIYSTGIGYRTDHIKPPPESFDNPYDIFYEEAYRGRTYLLDDYREAIAMLLLRNGVTDVNTGDEAALEQVRQDLLGLTDAVNVKTSVLDYTLVPEGYGSIRPGPATSSRPSTTSRRASTTRCSATGTRLMAAGLSGATRWPSRALRRTRSSPTSS